jgi:hypothetical protein
MVAFFGNITARSGSQFELKKEEHGSDEIEYYSSKLGKGKALGGGVVVTMITQIA